MMMRSRIRGRFAIAARLCGAGLALNLIAASAALSERLHGNTVIVFDGSGSMNGTTQDPSQHLTKIEVARTVVETLTSSLSAEPAIEIGLIVFGAEVDWHVTPRDRACEDVVLKEPRGPVTRSSVDRIHRAIRAVKPQGRTPLGRAIDMAAQALGPTGGSVVVVTDMEETCETPKDFFNACDVIQRANETRGPADRVYIDSIVVLRAPAMSMEAVSAFRNCTQAPIVEVTNHAEARKTASEVSSRLIALAHQGDHGEPSTASGRVVFLNASGVEIAPSDVDLVFIGNDDGREYRRSGSESASAFTLERGTYTIRVLRSQQVVIEQRNVNVSGPSFQIFLTLDN